MIQKFEFISYTTSNKVAVISFNRPDCYNAMNRTMKLEIIDALKEANYDDQVFSIIITHQGKAFSSGQDLNDRTVNPEEKIDLGMTLQTEWNPLVNAIYSSKKLVLAAVNGVVAGAGMSVALTCDYICCAPKTKFVSGFAQIGLCPDAGSSFLFAQSLGYPKSLEYFLSGTPLMSEDLLVLNLINQISENPFENVMNYAQKLSSLPPLAVYAIKQNLRYAQNHGRTETIERETHIQRYLGNTLDYREGVKAFIEKRPAQFKGQ